MCIFSLILGIFFDASLTTVFRNPNKMSIQSGKMVFSYMQRDNLCFLTLTEESYPKRLAFMYLDEVADAVLQELEKEFAGEVCVLCEC